MPGYGLPAADKGKGLLPWEWAVERLTESHNYWVATTRPEGRPPRDAGLGNMGGIGILLQHVTSARGENPGNPRIWWRIRAA